jgi:hypothetical protein
VWQHVGEGFVKEINFGRVWFRLNEADEGEKDVIVGEWKDDLSLFLFRTLVRPFFGAFQRMAAENIVGLFDNVGIIRSRRQCDRSSRD